MLGMEAQSPHDTTLSVFRMCDIRGVYPAEVHDDLFLGVGRAIARRWAKGTTVLVGCDCRTASPALKAALIAGLTAGGADVLDAGRVPTPLIYHGKRELGIAVAVIVTASHNPPDYHGLKLLLHDGSAMPHDISWLARNYSDATSGGREGGVSRVDLLPAYRAFLKKKWQNWSAERPSAASPPKVVIDPGNGAWSGIGLALFQDLGLECVSIHDQADGRFPGRSPDCADPRNLTALGERVRMLRAQIGLAWDGDGDRLAVLDEHGRVLSADQVSLLLIPLLTGRKGDRILVDVKMSRAIRREIAARKMELIVEKSAHCSLERSMREHECLFGCECSGHYFFRHLCGADDGLFAGLYLCHFAAAGTLSEALGKLPPMFITPDIRVPFARQDFGAIVDSVEKRFDPATISRLDGVRVDLPEGWFLVRCSVSEDKLSLRAEGETWDSLARMLTLLASILPVRFTQGILDAGTHYANAARQY
jgi:phosphomannomutase/phosphoglucomutase